MPLPCSTRSTPAAAAPRGVAVCTDFRPMPAFAAFREIFAMPKHKSHKGTLKRIRVTKTGKVKHKPASSGHLKSGKSADRLRRLRKTHALSNPDAKRFEKLLHRRLRGRDESRATLKRSPGPAERRAALAEKWAREDAAWEAMQNAAGAGDASAGTKKRARNRAERRALSGVSRAG